MCSPRGKYWFSFRRLCAGTTLLFYWWVDNSLLHTSLFFLCSAGAPCIPRRANVCANLLTEFSLFVQLSMTYLSNKPLNLTTFIVCVSALELQSASQSLFSPGFTCKGTSMLTVSNSCYGKKSSWMFPSSSSIVDLNLKIHWGWAARSSCSYRINSRHLLLQQAWSRGLYQWKGDTRDIPLLFFTLVGPDILGQANF